MHSYSGPAFKVHVRTWDAMALTQLPHARTPSATRDLMFLYFKTYLPVCKSCTAYNNIMLKKKKNVYTCT